MKTIKDPDGKPLKRVLLQVMDTDVQGPRTLVVRRDHEKIDLGDERQRTFLMVWISEDQVLGELRLTDILAEHDEVKEANGKLVAAKVEWERTEIKLRAELAEFAHDLDTKIEELRALQRERDPERVERMVAERTAAKTKELEGKLATAQALATSQESEINELRAAKKKLRERIDRLEQGRK